MSHKADRVAVVLNGNARQVTDELVESFDQLVGSGDLFLSKSLDEAHRVALQIVDAGYPVVLTGGGDGTFVQMVTAITKEARSRSQEPPCFGLLKLGTGNSLAWALGAGTSREGVFADLARLRHDSAHRDFRLIEVQGLLTAPSFGVCRGSESALPARSLTRSRSRHSRSPSSPFDRAWKFGSSTVVQPNVLTRTANPLGRASRRTKSFLKARASPRWCRRSRIGGSASGSFPSRTIALRIVFACVWSRRALCALLHICSASGRAPIATKN
ncbi:MAG: acylglycerol kinase family protein [Deltaproteobacteria bacterium]|nr:acylglycerol kinase family protein [Deltaproteobacteria bacterium]